MSSNVDVNFGYARGRGNRRQPKSPAVSRGRNTFQMGEVDIWEGRAEGAEQGRYDQAARAFNHSSYTDLHEGSISQRVAEAIIYTFPRVEIPQAVQMTRTEAAIRFVKHHLIKRSSDNDQRLIQHGVNAARQALVGAYNN